MIDSCNGVLLYASHNNGFWTYSVSSPVLNQFISLPISHHISRPTCSTLVFDVNGWNSFQVICFFWEEVDFTSQLMNCLIFESNSWKWRERKIRILNSDLLLDGFTRGQCFNPSVLSLEKRKLYWIWSLCLLEFNVELEFFTLFPLPKNNSRSNTVYYSQFLYESSSGVIHFCDTVNNGVFIWSFGENEFKFHHFIRLENINDHHSIKPCAFNKDLQVLYLHVLPYTIVAYSFETQELVQIWSYEEEEVCWVFKIHPFLFSAVDLLAFNKKNIEAKFD